jgi:hypothetical protein
MDAYALRNRLGAIECKLCQTVHPSEANYLVHTRGRRHRQAVKRREERVAKPRTLGSGRLRSKATPKQSSDSPFFSENDGTQTSRVQCWRLPGNQGLRLVTDQPPGETLQLLVVPQRDRSGQEVWLAPAHYCLRLEAGVFIKRVQTRVLTERRGPAQFQADIYWRRARPTVEKRSTGAVHAGRGSVPQVTDRRLG